MTREEIIERIERYIPWADEYEVDIEVLTGALELLKKEPCGDLISRQAVIESICKQYTEHNAIVPIWLSIGDLPSVTPTQNCVENALGALDCISRQAVDTLVDELARAISDERCCISRGRSTATIMQDILDLPPVNPQEPKWIPVSERLPEDEDYVLVCYADGSIRTAYYYIDTESYPPEFRDCCETGWYDYNEEYMYQDVLAWMPLPEPYKAESEDKE